MYKRPEITVEYLLGRSMPIPESGCWVWLGAVSSGKRGYPVISDKNGLAVKVTRLIWEMLHGSIPEGMFICHKCDVPSCINPDHLYAGTPKQNSADMMKRNRSYLQKVQGNVRRKRITREQAIAVMTSTKSLHEMAKEFSLQVGTLSYIRSGRTWKKLYAELFPNGNPNLRDKGRPL